MKGILLASRNDMIKALAGSEGTNIRQLTTFEKRDGITTSTYWNFLGVSLTPGLKEQNKHSLDG